MRTFIGNVAIYSPSSVPVGTVYRARCYAHNGGAFDAAVVVVVVVVFHHFLTPHPQMPITIVCSSTNRTFFYCATGIVPVRSSLSFALARLFHSHSLVPLHSLSAALAHDPDNSDCISNHEQHIHTHSKRTLQYRMDSIACAVH